MYLYWEKFIVVYDIRGSTSFWSTFFQCTYKKKIKHAEVWLGKNFDTIDINFCFLPTNKPFIQYYTTEE